VPLCVIHHRQNPIVSTLIHVYLRVNLTAQRPITKLAPIHRNTKKILKQDTKNMDLYNGNKLIIIPRILKLALTGEKIKYYHTHTHTHTYIHTRNIKSINKYY
jgi:hypothetical protein